MLENDYWWLTLLLLLGFLDYIQDKWLHQCLRVTQHQQATLAAEAALTSRDSIEKHFWLTPWAMSNIFLDRVKGGYAQVPWVLNEWSDACARRPRSACLTQLWVFFVCLFFSPLFMSQWYITAAIEAFILLHLTSSLAKKAFVPQEGKFPMAGTKRKWINGITSPNTQPTK